MVLKLTKRDKLIDDHISAREMMLRYELLFMFYFVVHKLANVNLWFDDPELDCELTQKWFDLLRLFAIISLRSVALFNLKEHTFKLFWSFLILQFELMIVYIRTKQIKVIFIILPIAKDFFIVEKISQIAFLNTDLLFNLYSLPVIVPILFILSKANLYIFIKVFSLFLRNRCLISPNSCK